MKIYCGNDECKCAIEQILLNMFPTEKVEFSCGKAYGDSYVCADVKEGKVYTVARVVIVRDGKKECANARIINNHEDLKDRDRAYRSLIKVAFYKAARRILNKDNPWGAMTGIRPAKFAEMEILKHSAAHTEKYLKERFFVSDDRIHMCMEVAKKSIEIRKEHTDRDASIYIGIPFCPTRCAYCSFISNAISKNEKLMDRYVQCLKDEIINTAKTVKELNLDVKSVYFALYVLQVPMSIKICLSSIRYLQSMAL